MDLTFVHCSTHFQLHAPASSFISSRTIQFSQPKRCKPSYLHKPHWPKAQLEPLLLSEENVNVALEEVKAKLGSMFGNNAENRDVGITGDVELASLDGPIVVLRLKGRFWHKRSDVVCYLTPEIPISTVYQSRKPPLTTFTVVLLSQCSWLESLPTLQSVSRKYATQKSKMCGSWKILKRKAVDSPPELSVINFHLSTKFRTRCSSSWSSLCAIRCAHTSPIAIACFSIILSSSNHRFFGM